MCLNLFAILASVPFSLIPKEYYYFLIPLSVVATYRFFYTFRTYDIYDFEDLYAHLKQGVNTQQLKDKDIYQYYYKVMAYLAQRFPGVHFEYKLTKRDQGEKYLKAKDQSACVRYLSKFMKRVWKNLVRSVLFCRVPTAGDRFVQASEQTHIKYIRAQYWQQDEVKWIYFMYLNLPVIITLFFGGYQMIFIDILFILLASKLNEAVRMQGFGDRLLKEALGKIEKDTSKRMNEERLRNGQIV